MAEDTRKYNPGKFFRRQEVQIAALSAITVLALLLSLLNAAGMQNELEGSTREYCQAITGQITDAIRDGINNKITEAVNVADSVAQLSNVEKRSGLEEFLARKARILDFDALILLDRQGSCVVQAGLENVSMEAGQIAELDSVQGSFQDGVHMGFFGEQTMVYSAPVQVEREVPYVLVGLRSKENIQGMIASKAFHGKTLSCIVDSHGEVILSPSDLKPFTVLNSIFQHSAQDRVSQEIRRMQADMLEGTAGSLRFTDVYGSSNLLAYTPLKINDWFVLTIVPADLISSGISLYVSRVFLIVGGTALMFLLLLLLVYRIYNNNQKHLRRLAFVDRITGGMNEAAFRLKYRQVVREQQLPHCAIVLLNVKNFKLINQKLGFLAGNETLQDIGQVIEEHLEPQRHEFAARCETDHFFLCMAETRPQVIQERINGIQADINRRWIRKSGQYQLSFTSGCCIMEDMELEVRAIQDRARIAAQTEEAKVQNSCVFYNDSIAGRVKREQELDAMFDAALANHDFQVYLQPKMDLKSQRPAGAEALVRWEHPEWGLISPAEFIPLFERTGKICRLDLYVFEEVCRLYKKRRAEGKVWYPVSVNLSRYHFYEENFLDKFYDIYRACEMPENSIEFELTESMFFDPEHIVRIKNGIIKMHEMGFRCSMDDFGSGYSSLGLLKEFDVDTLKLDRSFFLDISSQKARDIIRSVVELAAKLRVETVAEGIEETEQMEFLHSVNCDTVQGYIFSKPLPISGFEEWVSKYEDGR